MIAVKDKSSLNGFFGSDRRQHLISALKSQGIIQNEKLAKEFARRVRLEEVPSHTTIMTKGSSDHDLIFILSGEFLVTVGGQTIARRMAGDHVGEMTVIDPKTVRSATVIAARDSVIARISEPKFSSIADRFPLVWRRIAQKLAERLRETPPVCATQAGV